MNHKELCLRAQRWLRGTRRCEPVFANIASCGEIPDAIGWSSCYGWRGSTVVECKTSVSDFYADLRKRWRWQKTDKDLTGREYKSSYPARRLNEREASELGFVRVELPAMGNYRFYLCEEGVLPEKLVCEKAPDHGLLWRAGRSVRIIINAPRRTENSIDHYAEIRYLRFAIINKKEPFEMFQVREEVTCVSS